MLWVAEYGRLYKGTSNKNLDAGDVELDGDDFEALCSLVDTSAGEELNPIFRHSIIHGRECLSATQHVGVVRTESGCQFEILPKLTKQMDPDRAREILVKMLVELPDSPLNEGVLADLRAYEMPLFELLIRQFLDHVGDIVRKGIARSYIQRQDDLLFLRGKLRISENIKRNATARNRFSCEFDEFEMNWPINRLIKGALEIVSRMTQDADNQQRCREFLFWFDPVPATTDPAGDFRLVRNERLIQHYQPAMPICRLILEGLNPLATSGDHRVLSMFFDMNKVFENYVAVKLREQFPQWRQRTQTSEYSLVENHAGRKMFRMQPDLEFVQGNRRVVADTKWKLLEPINGKANYGISQSDVYQMFAYAQKYLATQERKRILLIYPRHDEFQNPLSPFWFKEEPHEVLYVLPFDLEADKLIVPENFFLYDSDVVEARNLVA